MLETPKEQLNILTCQSCAGTGLVGRERCSLCRGMGFGAMFDDKFLYWGKHIDSLEIATRKARNLVGNIFNFLLLVFGVITLGLFGFRLWTIGPESVFGLSFWKTANFYLLLLYLGILSFIYLYYRAALVSLQKVSVPKKAYGAAPAVLGPSLNWEDAKKLSKAKKIDISKTLSLQALGALEAAYQKAKKLGQGEISPLHLILTLLALPKVKVIFGRLGTPVWEIERRINRIFKEETRQRSQKVLFSSALREILFWAYKEAYDASEERVDAEHLLSSSVEKDKRAVEILYDLGIDMSKLRNVIAWQRIHNLLRQRMQRFRKAAKLKPGGVMDKAMTALATPVLDRYSQDLTRLAKWGYFTPCIGREEETESILRIMEGGRKGVLLVGSPGVGKTTLVEGLAERMVREDVPKILQDKRLVSLNTAELQGGASPALAGERILAVLRDTQRAGNIVLYIPNIHLFTGESGEETNLASILATELSSSFLPHIASTTPLDYSRALEPSALKNVFEKVEIREPSPDQTIQILEAKAPAIEYKESVFFSYDAIETAATLSARYMPDRYLPEKAIEILREAAITARKKKGAKAIVSKEDAAEIIAEKTKIPVTAVTEEEKEKLLRLEEKMHERMINQDEAVKAVAASLRRARAELRETKRPIGNFLFLGPTGVGKTELAKTIAEVYFGSEETMIRLDMSEYQDKSSVYRLIGSPIEKTGGLLTETVRNRPFSLLLLDEIEKAHPDILNIFLQVMDEGRLTDSAGRTVDFTNIILIGTSNAGTSFIQEEIKKGAPLDEIKTQMINVVLKPYFRPEFLNRFDGIMVFRPLKIDEIEQIAWLMLAKIQMQLEKKGIALEITDEAVRELAEAGFDPTFGARPLRRVIQERVQDVIANFLLQEKAGRRDVIILEPGGKIRILKAKKL